MKILKLNPENPDMELINKAIDVMAEGGVILYPTDTVYGLGANIFNKEAVERINKIKQRESDKPLSTRKNIVVISDEAHRSQYGLTERIRINNVLKELQLAQGIANSSYTFKIRHSNYFAKAVINKLDKKVKVVSISHVSNVT